jgi:hypothetical protein
VRREKISERMKLLESLVPGCNKVRTHSFSAVSPIAFYIHHASPDL